MNGYYSKQPRFWRGLSFAIGLSGVLLWPSAVKAQDATRPLAQSGRSVKQRADKQPENPESSPASLSTDRQDQPLSWARIDFILNRVNLVPRRSSSRRARISDVLGIGDALQTFESSNAELRFNDGSEVRIGSQATFRFTPNTRNFQLTNGTVLLLIPPERGRTTIQTPNAVTGIQGSALFVRYIEETDTTIVGALTDNADGPMILYTNNGTEQQALYANQVGVVKGDRITELYEIDSRAFWETSGLAETFDYTQDAGPVDELDGVRQEIREAVENQAPIDGSNVVENPENFSRPESAPTEAVEPNDNPVEAPGEPTNEGEAEGSQSEGGQNEGSQSEGNGGAAVGNPDLTIGGTETEETEGRVIQYEGSPAEEFHNQNQPAAPGTDATNALKPAALTEAESGGKKPAVSTGNSDRPNASANPSGASANQPGANKPAVNVGGGVRPEGDRPAIRPVPTTTSPSNGGGGGNDRPANNNLPATPGTTTAGDPLIVNPVLPALPNGASPEIIVPPSIGAGKIPTPTPTPTAQPNVPTGGVTPLPGSALQDAEPGKTPADKVPNPEDETEGNGAESATPPSATPAVDSSNKPVIEETGGSLNNPDTAEVVAPPPTVSEDEPGAAAAPPIIEGPIIEGTDATPNNPGEVTDSEAVIPPSGLTEAEVLGDEAVVEVDAPETPVPEVAVPEPQAAEIVETSPPQILEDELGEVLENPTPVQLEGTVPFVVEQVDELPAGQVPIGQGNGQVQ